MQMHEKLQSYLQIADGLIKIGGLVAIAYVIIVGLAHRAGSRFGEQIFQRRRQREQKPIFKALLKEERQPPFWKDERLIHGGLRGIASLGLLSSFVVFMLLTVPRPLSELHRSIAILLGYPNFMVSLGVVATVLTLARDAGFRLWLLTGLSIVLAASTYLVMSRTDSMGHWQAFGLQGLIFFLQSLAVSYTVGVTWGIRESDLEKKLPLVEVTTRTGLINNVRMRSSSKGEYRFLASDGAELLIPAAQVRSIRTADSGDDKGASKP